MKEKPKSTDNKVIELKIKGKAKAKARARARVIKANEPNGLKIEWNISPDITTRFATNILVQRIENEFRVAFYELKPEPTFNEEDRIRIEEKGIVKAECVASIIVTADRMQGFIRVLSDQLAKWEESKVEKPSR